MPDALADKYTHEIENDQSLLEFVKTGKNEDLMHSVRNVPIDVVGIFKEMDVGQDFAPKGRKRAAGKS